MNARKKALTTILFSCTAIGWSGTITVGTPSNTSLNVAPIVGAAFFQTTEYEQVYAASRFSGVTTITSFRLLDLSFNVPGLPACSASGSACEINGGDWTVYMSTTTRAVNGLSTIQSSNIGPDEQTFGTYHFTAGPTTADYLTFTGATPFTYDPSNGNLLLRFAGANLTTTGTQRGGFNEDSSGSVTRRAVHNTSPDFRFADTLGVVTEFTITGASPGPSAPEPSAAWLAVAGICALAVRKRRVS